MEKCIISLCFHTHTEWHQPSIVIYLTPVNVSVFYGPQSPSFCLSIFSHRHSPKQSPSITTSLHFSPSLSIFISPSSTVNHSFPFSPSPALPTYISLLYQQPPSLTHLPFLPPPLICFPLFLCQSSKPWGVLRWSIFILSALSHYQVKPKHIHTPTHIYYNKWTTNAKIYIWLRWGAVAVKENTHTHNCTRWPPHTHMLAHVPIIIS